MIFLWCFFFFFFFFLILGDTVGCGIIYPLHYKRYADLSTDDNSDGMTDVVLSSLLNTNSKSMNFVCSVLNFNNGENDESSDSEISSCETKSPDANDYYNENYVESRRQVEVSCYYFCQTSHLW